MVVQWKAGAELQFPVPFSSATVPPSARWGAVLKGVKLSRDNELSSQKAGPGFPACYRTTVVSVSLFSHL